MSANRGRGRGSKSFPITIPGQSKLTGYFKRVCLDLTQSSGEVIETVIEEKAGGSSQNADDVGTVQIKSSPGSTSRQLAEKLDNNRSSVVSTPSDGGKRASLNSNMSFGSINTTSSYGDESTEKVHTSSYANNASAVSEVSFDSDSGTNKKHHAASSSSSRSNVAVYELDPLDTAALHVTLAKRADRVQAIGSVAEALGAGPRNFKDYVRYYDAVADAGISCQDDVCFVCKLGAGEGSILSCSCRVDSTGERCTKMYHERCVTTLYELEGSSSSSSAHSRRASIGQVAQLGVDNAERTRQLKTLAANPSAWVCPRHRCYGCLDDMNIKFVCSYCPLTLCMHCYGAPRKVDAVFGVDNSADYPDVEQAQSKYAYRYYPVQAGNVASKCGVNNLNPRAQLIVCPPCATRFDQCLALGLMVDGNENDYAADSKTGSSKSHLVFSMNESVLVGCERSPSSTNGGSSTGGNGSAAAQSRSSSSGSAPKITHKLPASAAVTSKLLPVPVAAAVKPKLTPRPASNNDGGSGDDMPPPTVTGRTPARESRRGIAGDRSSSSTNNNNNNKGGMSNPSRRSLSALASTTSTSSPTPFTSPATQKARQQQQQHAETESEMEPVGDSSLVLLSDSESAGSISCVESSDFDSDSSSFATGGGSRGEGKGVRGVGKKKGMAAITASSRPRRGGAAASSRGEKQDAAVAAAGMKLSSRRSSRISAGDGSASDASSIVVPAGGRKGSRGKAAANDDDSEILDSTTENDSSSAEQHRRVLRTTRGSKTREVAETARPRRELGKKSQSEVFLKRIQKGQKKQYPGKYADGDSEDDDTEDSAGALKRRGGRGGEAATTATTKKATRERLAARRALKQQQQAEAETETETEVEEKPTKRGRPAGKAVKKEDEKSSKKPSQGGARKRDREEDSDRDAELAAATTKGSKVAAAVKEEKGQIAGPGVFVPGRFLFADTANDEDEELKMELAAAAAAGGEDNGDIDSAKQQSGARCRKPLKSKKAFVGLGPDTTFSGHLDTAFGYADCHNPATLRRNALRQPLSKAAQARKIKTDGAEPAAEEVPRLALEKLRLTLRQTGKLTGFSGALLGLSGVWLKPLGSKHRPKTPAWDAWLLAARGEGSDSGKKGSGNQQPMLPPMPSAPPALALTELSNALDQTESAAFSRQRDYLSSLALAPPSPPSNGSKSHTNASEGMVVVQLVGKCSFSDLQKRFVQCGPSRVLKRALEFQYSHGLSSAQVVINALIMQQHQQHQGGVLLKLPAAADVDALLFGAVRLRNQSQKQAHCCQLLALEEAATRPVPVSLVLQMAASATADTGTETTTDGAAVAVGARPGVLCFDAFWTWQPCFVKFVSLLDTVCALLLQQRLEEEHLSGAGADKKHAEKRARVAVKTDSAAAPAASSSYRSNEGAVKVLAGAAACLRFHAVFMTRAQAQEVLPAAGSSSSSSSSSSSMDVEGEDEEDIMMGLCDDSSSTSAGARSGSTSLQLVPRLYSVLEAAGASAEESFFLLLMEMCKLWRVYNSLVRDAVVCEAERLGRGRLGSLVSSCLAAAGHVLSRLYFLCHDMKEFSGTSQGVAVNAVLHKANKELDYEELLGVASFCSVGLAPLSSSLSSDNDYSSSSLDADDAGFGGAPATVLFLQRLAAGVLHGPGGHLGPADGAHGNVRQARELRAREVLAALNMELFSRRLGGAVG